MTCKVVIVDYGIGNLYSVTRAFETCGASVTLTANHEHIEGAERVVLPGVGAFEDGMKGMRMRGQIEPVKRYVASGRPFLGICVGMQLLMDVGEEFGEHAGLGIIAGRCKAIPRTRADGKLHRVPHIGWNALVKPQGADWSSGLLVGLPEKPPVYFVHSFAPVPVDDRHRVADCDYDGRCISAVIRSGNVHGCQFHPEKSGSVGLKIIANFCRG